MTYEERKEAEEQRQAKAEDNRAVIVGTTQFAAFTAAVGGVVGLINGCFLKGLLWGAAVPFIPLLFWGPIILAFIAMGKYEKTENDFAKFALGLFATIVALVYFAAFSAGVADSHSISCDCDDCFEASIRNHGL